MAELSTIQKIATRRVCQPGAFLFLLEITVGVNIIRLVGNTENITWGGETWVAFPFEIDEITEDAGGEIPTINLRVSNLSKVIFNYIDANEGGSGSSIIVRIINSEQLDLVTPYFEEEMAVRGVPWEPFWIALKLGADFVTSQRVPGERFMKDFCFKQFKGVECGYAGEETACNRTLAACRALDNQVRYGGFPGLPGGLYVE